MPAPEPSIFRRMFRSWTVRGIVLAIAAIYGWFQFNEWRWEKKWERYVAESRARGVKMFIGEFLPKETIPDDENFAATPIWREVFAVGNMDGPIGSKLKAVPAPKAVRQLQATRRRPATRKILATNCHSSNRPTSTLATTSAKRGNT